MGDDMADLAIRLRTLAGSIMEDASAGAILGREASGLQAIRRAAQDSITLIQAAEVVQSRQACS